MKELILINTDKLALIDDEDFEKLNSFKWYISSLTGGFSVFRNMVGLVKKQTLANAVNNTIDLMYDHQDRNPLNNQKYNLRVANYTQNNHNKCKLYFPSLVKKQSEYKGVSYKQGRGKWRARITYQGIEHHIGTFKFQEEAARAYDKKAKELYGEFACLNFPEQ